MADNNAEKEHRATSPRRDAGNSTMNADGTFGSPKFMPPIKVRKMNDQEIKDSADRLAKAPKKDVELPPLCERRVLTAEVMNKSLERLYTASVQGKKRMLEELDKKQHPDMVKHTQLDHESLEGMFTRLYSQSIQRKQDSLEKLRSKYMAQPAKVTRLSKDQLGESAQRLCNASVDAQRENHAKLFEKYVLATAPKYQKLTPEQVKASAERLCSKK